jgi:hypothetical protein
MKSSRNRKITTCLSFWSLTVPLQLEKMADLGHGPMFPDTPSLGNSQDTTYVIATKELKGTG